MIQSIHIQNFKSIENQIVDFKPLTILTGTNSAGKSSVIQAILFYINRANHNVVLNNYLHSLGTQRDLFFVNASKKQCTILPIINGKEMLPMNMVFDLDTTQNDKVSSTQNAKWTPKFEQDIFYLSANRIGQENICQIQDNIKIGISGEYIFGFYEFYKNIRLENEKLIRKEANAESLNAQVNFWLNKILDLNLMPLTQKIDNIRVKVSYHNFDLDGAEMSPFNLGAGVSYLTKILILGLSLKEGDILIVENPEVHLHPKAISNFAEFFMFLANGGIQVILETHSEHIINKMRYFVFKGQLSSKEVQIYYRERFDKPFDSIRINDKGKYINIDNKIIEFPAGFFDSDLDELLEMM